MTVATFFYLYDGGKIGFREQLILQEALNKLDLQGMVSLVLKIIVITFVIEGLGLIVLSSAFVPRFGLKNGLYYALFHTVSAFNNAGFDLFGPYREIQHPHSFCGQPARQFYHHFVDYFGRDWFYRDSGSAE